MGKSGEPCDLESLMSYLGDFGKYQAWQFFLHILSAIFAGLSLMSLVTVAAVPEYRCEIPGVDQNKTYTALNDSMLARHLPKLASGKFDRCALLNITTNISYSCQSYVYDHSQFGNTRAVKWEFICDRRWMGAVAQSVYMFGAFVGAVVLGKMADIVGRKPVFCWSAVFHLLFGVAVSFTPDYYSFLVIRFLYGIFGTAGSYIAGLVLTMELVGPSKRSICGISFHAAFAFGMMLVAGWAAFIKDRQLLQIIYGCHAIILMGHFWLMDESPRWLWSNGRVRESVHIIQKALKMNGKAVNLNTAEFVSKGMSEVRTKDDSGSVGDLFRTPNLRRKTLNLLLCWFANSLVYYGLSFSTSSLKGDPFVVLFVMGLVEIPSYAATVYLMDRWGRRLLTSFDMILGGICCIIAATLSQGAASTVFAMAGKFLIASSFAITYNYSAELFPTVIRSSAIGLGVMCARTSGALTPLMTLLESFNPKMPAIIFAVISIVSGLLVMFLPETLNKPMPQTIQDGEQFGKGDTLFSAWCGSGGDKLRKVENEQLHPLK